MGRIRGRGDRPTGDRRGEIDEDHGGAGDDAAATKPRRLLAGTRALVLTAESPRDMLAMQVVYGLRAAGARVDVLGDGRSGVPRLSRYVSHYARADLPSPDTPETPEAEDFLERLFQRIARRSIDVLVPADMRTVRLVAALGRRLDFVAALPVAPLALLDRLADKDAFARLCDSLGLPHVPTVRIDDFHAAVDGRVARLGAPFLVKPLGDSGGRGGRELADATALADLLASDAPFSDPPLIAQRRVEGTDCAVCLAARDGQPIAAAFQRRAGPGRTAFEHHAEAIALARRLVSATGYSGLMRVAMRLEADTERPVILGCEPRPWGSMRASTFAGVNFVALATLAAIAPDDLPAVEPRRTTVVSYGRLVADLAARRRGRAGLSRDDLSSAWQLASDPLPIAWNLAQALRRPPRARA
ncbi:MAG: ATP-grasp domain-containing protein [Azospirillaceae bacterium]